MRRTLRATIIAIAGTAVIASSGASATPTAGADSAPASARVAQAYPLPYDFDLSSHRGGRGETIENSLPAFEKSIRLGVTTLELDVVLSKDKVPVVWHDKALTSEKCTDTGPVRQGDSAYPYVGKLVKNLTYAQIATVNCNKKLTRFPNAQTFAFNRVVRLPEVFDLVNRYNSRVRFSIETKTEADRPQDSADPGELVDAVMSTVLRYGFERRTTIESYDWRELPIVRERYPYMPTAMLWDEESWRPGSPWTGPVDYNAVGGNIFTAAKIVGANVLSPGYSQPLYLTPRDPNFRLVADRNFIERAHREGFWVIPWTVDDPDAIRAQIEAGPDGIITDYPTRLRQILQSYGIPVVPPGN